MTDRMTANKAEAIAAYERARHGALGDASRILTTLQNAEFGDGDWGHTGSMEHWAHDLHEVSDDLHQEGEFADVDVDVGSPATERFVKLATAQGLDVEPYAGRFFWKGPSVSVDRLGDFGAPGVATQHDNLGLGFIVYPVESDEGWYEQAIKREREDRA